MRVLITGASGFIGKNLKIQLMFLYKEAIIIDEYHRDTSDGELIKKIKAADFIFHLAGENRPTNATQFMEGNANLTKKIVDFCAVHHPIPILYASSTQIDLPNDYGRSKLLAEQYVADYSVNANQPVYIFRLANVFGKWAKPNYNSFIVTVCYNLARNLPITVDDYNKEIALLYIDDVVNSFISTYQHKPTKCAVLFPEVTPLYKKSLGDIIALVESFKLVSKNLIVPDAANGFVRALYATYLSYIPAEQFSYDITDYSDARGSFYEIIKSANNGQVSISTTAPGITRGNHFHHTKNEKFLVVKGKARFRFRHLITDELIEIIANDSKKQMIEVPTGYTHEFTNIGEHELIILLWANEIFDKEKPDTYFLAV